MMSKKILALFCGVMGLLTTGCEFDGEGRARFSERHGSMKDTKRAVASSDYEKKRSLQAASRPQAALRQEKPSPSSGKDRIPNLAQSQSDRKTAIQKTAEGKPQLQADPVKIEDQKQQTVKVEPLPKEGQNKVAVSKEIPSKPTDNSLEIKKTPASGTALLNKTAELNQSAELDKKTDNTKKENGQPEIKKDSGQAPVQNSLEQQKITQNQPATDGQGVGQTGKNELPQNQKPQMPAQLSEVEAENGKSIEITVNPDDARAVRSVVEANRQYKAEVVPQDTNKAYANVKVYYGTDRNITGQPDTNAYYGAERSVITYGMCEVSIPKKHKAGELEKPSVWRFELSENPENHVVLMTVKTQNKTDFFSDLKRRVDISTGKNAFLFVHGYNVDFSEAARRTAQIAYDLNFDGAPVFFSWPSRGNVTDYARDEATIDWTEKNMKRFVRDFALRSDAENIYLIAHSMGSRALTNAVAELVTEMPAFKKRFKEIVLAAPDIDADVFRRDIAPKLVEASKNVTLYAASDDKAIQISRTLHGEPRAGDAGENLMIFDGIDTVDATGIDISFFKHSYFADAPSILSDLHSIVHFGSRPGQRGALKRVQHAKGPYYWTFLNNKIIIINGDASVIKNETTEIRH